MDWRKLEPAPLFSTRSRSMRRSVQDSDAMMTPAVVERRATSMHLPVPPLKYDASTDDLNVCEHAGESVLMTPLTASRTRRVPCGGGLSGSRALSGLVGVAVLSSHAPSVITTAAAIMVAPTPLRPGSMSSRF